MKPNYVPVNILEEFKDLEKAVALDELFKKEKWKLVKAYDDYSKEIGYQLYFGEGIQVDNNYEYGFPYLLNREEYWVLGRNGVS